MSLRPMPCVKPGIIRNPFAVLDAALRELANDPIYKGAALAAEKIDRMDILKAICAPFWPRM